MKRFIFLSMLFMMCLVSQAQNLKPKKVEVQVRKKTTNVSKVEGNNPKKSAPFKKKIVTTRISIQASELKKRK